VVDTSLLLVVLTTGSCTCLLKQVQRLPFSGRALRQPEDRKTACSAALHNSFRTYSNRLLIGIASR